MDQNSDDSSVYEITFGKNLLDQVIITPRKQSRNHKTSKLRQSGSCTFDKTPCWHKMSGLSLSSLSNDMPDRGHANTPMNFEKSPYICEPAPSMQPTAATQQ